EISGGGGADDINPALGVDADGIRDVGQVAAQQSPVDQSVGGSRGGGIHLQDEHVLGAAGGGLVAGVHRRVDQGGVGGRAGDDDIAGRVKGYGGSVDSAGAAIIRRINQLGRAGEGGIEEQHESVPGGAPPGGLKSSGGGDGEILGVGRTDHRQGAAGGGGDAGRNVFV